MARQKLPRYFYQHLRTHPNYLGYYAKLPIRIFSRFFLLGRIIVPMTNNKNTAEIDTAKNAVDIKTTIKKNDWGEWVVRLNVDGQFVSDYHTNDIDDALETADRMREQLERINELRLMLQKASFTGLVQVVADKMGIEIEMPDFHKATQSLSSASHLRDDFEEVIYSAIMREIETLEKEVEA